MDTLEEIIQRRLDTVKGNREAFVKDANEQMAKFTADANTQIAMFDAVIMELTTLLNPPSPSVIETITKEQLDQTAPTVPLEKAEN